MLGEHMRIPFFPKKERRAYWLATVCSAAVLLRLFYVFVTPYDVRGHDAPGHLDYVMFVANTLSLPPPDDGFEYYQPPLYYVMAAPFAWAARAANASDETRDFLIQLFSLVCSAVTFFIGIRMGRKFFPNTAEKTSLHLYAAILAATPSFVFFAARLNNDALFQVWAFLSFLLLLAWWKKPNATVWFAICAVIGLGLLTKTSMALIALPCFLCLLLEKKSDWKQKLVLALGGVAVILLIAGWFHVPRTIDDGSKKAIVGNYEALTNFVENDIGNFLTFNPIAMLAHPYNDPYDDGARRQEFWEYLFRSALYGEFHFGDDRRVLAMAMLISSFLMIPFVLWNLVDDIRKRARASLPVWSTFLCLLGGAAAFRIAFPYSSSQDFRYSILLLPIFAYYAVRETGANPLLRHLQIVLAGVFSGAAAGFLLTL